jgi:outer membrane immunogenic protein
MALAVLATAPAAAKDRAPLNAYNAPVVALYEWTGFYIGGNIGGSFGRARSDIFATGLPATASPGGAMNGVLGGLQFGYNARFDRLFFGLETDFQGTSQRGNSTVTDFIPGTPGVPGTPTIPGTPAIPCILFDPPAPACIPGTGIPATPDIPGTPAIPGRPAAIGIIGVQNQLPWFGTLRGRFGVTPAERWWLYVTGGLAYGNVTTTESLVVNGVPMSVRTDSIKAGWVLGAGIETFVWNNWTVKLEYLYIDFGNVGATTFAGIAPIALVTGSSHLTDNIVRVGFNYHFVPSIP